VKGPDYKGSLDELINANISAINEAEIQGESQHFLNE